MKMKAFANQSMISSLLACALSLGLSLVSRSGLSQIPRLSLAPNEKLVTILGTNDLHGGVEHQLLAGAKAAGGLAIIDGIFRATKEGLKKSYGSERAGALIVDSGDQFQGTLISNINEGQLVFAALNEVGYDAVIPGNHDYDFGPIDWEVDQDPSGRPNRDALLRLAMQAKFPLLSANTYYKASLTSVVGAPIGPQNISSVGCVSRTGEAIHWGNAVRPEFLKPYIIKEVAGLRVALIGIDHISTSEYTTAANVSDICFRDEAQSYFEVRASLQGRADIFILLVHSGNTNREKSVSEMVVKIVRAAPQVPNMVDAVMAGHTHMINNDTVGFVPIVQGGANGKMFSRVDLIWNNERGALDKSKTRFRGGIPAHLNECPENSFSCEFNAVTHQIRIEGEVVVPNQRIAAFVQAERKRISPIASTVLAAAMAGPILSDRIGESPLANVLTDSIRTIGKADIAFLNTGGIRTSLPQGLINYENLFQVLPFNNLGVVLGPMDISRVLTLILQSAQTCGDTEALMQSGLMVTIERNCAAGAGAAMLAKLVEVKTVQGEVLFKDGQIVVPSTRTFQVATIDFLAKGGSGFKSFIGVPQLVNLGIMRQQIAGLWFKSQPKLSPQLDGRWVVKNNR